MSFGWMPPKRPNRSWIVFQSEPAWLVRARRWHRRFLQEPLARGLAALAVSVGLHVLVFGVACLPLPLVDGQQAAGFAGMQEIETRLQPLPQPLKLDRSEAPQQLLAPIESRIPLMSSDEAALVSPQAPEVGGAAPNFVARSEAHATEDAAFSTPQSESPAEAEAGMLATFVGASGRGVRFCIVADRSGSMRGRKLDYVKHQIRQTVAAMPPHLRFQVIMFGSEPTSFGAQWRKPGQDFAELEAWLGGISAEGDTQPTRAIAQALAMTPVPDVIFFLTDGEFPDRVADHVAALNGAGVVIQTIAFLDRTGEPQLQRIARDSGGEYRYVSDF